MFSYSTKKSNITRDFDLFLKSFLFEMGKFFVVPKVSYYLGVLVLGFL